MAASSVLAFGNPGAGKSSLLNILLAEPRFEAGVSIAAGLTRELRRAVVNGVTYFDVPGLSDCSFRTEAAAAITEALKQAGICKVIFMVTLENGRVRPDDAVTIRAVLLAAPAIAGYGVVVNGLPAPVVRKLADPRSREAITEALMEIIPPNRRTTSFFFQPQSDALYCQEHHHVDYEACRRGEFAGLVAFVEREVQPSRIRPEDVTPVDPASFVQMLAKYAELKKEAAALAEKLRAEAAARARAEQAAKEAAARAAQEAQKARAAERDRDLEAQKAREAERGRQQEAAKARDAEAKCSTAQNDIVTLRGEVREARRQTDEARQETRNASAGFQQRVDAEVTRRLSEEQDRKKEKEKKEKEKQEDAAQMIGVGVGVLSGAAGTVGTVLATAGAAWATGGAAVVVPGMAGLCSAVFGGGAAYAANRPS